MNCLHAIRERLVRRWRLWRLYRLRRHHTRLCRLHLRATTLYGDDMAQAVARLVALDAVAEEIRKRERAMGIFQSPCTPTHPPDIDPHDP